MTVFISHSFENQPEFDNVADALAQQDVAYWNPAEVLAGANLREQLRLAVEQCCMCIFVASAKSVESSWCGAELGAFWGAGKPILVYLAEPSLPESALPQVVQGDVWERRLSKLADRAKQIHGRPEAAGQPRGSTLNSVASLSVEQLENMIKSAVSLAAATAQPKSGDALESYSEVGAAASKAAGKILAGFQASEIADQASHTDWQHRILWVDDRPENNRYLRLAMEAMGLQFTLALSTEDALASLSTRRFAAIISDMGRKEGPREGYALLEAVRDRGLATPYFIFAGSNSAEHRREAQMRGAQGSTNRADDLVEMVTQALPTRLPRSPAR